MLRKKKEREDFFKKHSSNLLYIAELFLGVAKHPQLPLKSMGAVSAHSLFLVLALSTWYSYDSYLPRA